MPTTIDMDELGAPYARPRPFRFSAGVLIGLLVLLFLFAHSIASTVIDYSWWAEVHQTAAWWTQLRYEYLPLLAGTFFAFLLLYLFQLHALRGTGLSQFSTFISLALLVAAFLLASVNLSSRDIAQWVGSQGAGISSPWRDPIFGKPLTFYFFDLPFYRDLTSLLFSILVVGTLVHGAIRVFATSHRRFRESGAAGFVLDVRDIVASELRFTRMLGAAALVLLAVVLYWSRYDPLYDEHTFLTGMDYVSTNITLPLIWVEIGAALVGALFVALGWRNAALALLLVVPVKALLPGIVNAFYVKPNEITLQRDYISQHIQATRSAYGLSKDTRKMNFDARQDAKIDVARNRQLLDNVRLWDWRAFHDTVSQIQPLRPYTYVDTDVDRYTVDGKMQQVLISPRELEISQLGEAKNRWPNSHVIYTHGYGIVAADANRITADGLPRLLVQDAPPRVNDPRFALKRPEIYYGEVEHEPVFVGTAQQEFNYPSGSDNVHNRYQGSGGFPVSGFGMRLAAAVAYSDANTLFTGYLTPGSRMMIRRRVSERCETLAPFLVWDNDPYLVLTPEGTLVWMLDAYSVSRRHPFSQMMRTSEHGSLNYVRNSVKATVDAYSGETRLYIFDAEDPIIRAYQHLYPGLLHAREEMPAELQAHARFPEWIFRLQAEIIGIFHMEDPESFYNKVDAWEIAGRNVSQDGSRKPMEPTYIVAALPGGDPNHLEFLLTLPFTPRGKDNLIGMLFGRSDGSALGELVQVELPKKELFYGPMQIESRINQDQTISKDLTLWNQQGSEVLRGQILAIPVDDAILYVQPIYLQASQARMPQLKKVVLAVGNQLAYADTYNQALAQLAGIRTEEPDTPITTTSNSTATQPAKPTVETAAQRLSSIEQHMQRYRSLASQGKWSDAGKELEAMEGELQRRK